MREAGDPAGSSQKILRGIGGRKEAAKWIEMVKIQNQGRVARHLFCPR